MITSVAVVASTYDADISPLDVFNSSYRHTYPNKGIEKLSKKAFSCRSASTKKNMIVNNLKKGNIVVIMVKDKSAFSNSQHYIALLDIKHDESKIFIGNSFGSGNSGYNKTGWFKTDTVLTDVRESYVCVPSDSLIEKFN